MAKLFLAGLLLAQSLLLPALAEPQSDWQSLKNPHGAIEAQLLMPAGPGPHPLLVLAPGQSCNARRPFFEAFSQAGRAHQVAVLRLEWSYCSSAQKQPSPGLVNEVADLSQALAYARRQPGIDSRRILIGGKSLGSLVAWQLFRREPSLAAAALLTPVCSYETDQEGKPLPERSRLMAENYPGLGSEPHPLLFLLGDQDSLCHPPILYEALAGSSGKASVAVLGGGHGLNLSTPQKQDDPEATAQNLRLAGELLFNWAKRVTAP